MDAQLRPQTHAGASELVRLLTEEAPQASLKAVCNRSCWPRRLHEQHDSFMLDILHPVKESGGLRDLMRRGGAQVRVLSAGLAALWTQWCAASTLWSISRRRASSMVTCSLSSWLALMPRQTFVLMSGTLPKSLAVVPGSEASEAPSVPPPPLLQWELM